jgi:hypothetical protein
MSGFRLPPVGDTEDTEQMGTSHHQKNLFLELTEAGGKRFMWLVAAYFLHPAPAFHISYNRSSSWKQ